MTTPSSRASASQRLGGGPGDRLGQLEQFGVFLAAEILRAEQFLQADDLRAACRPLRGCAIRFRQIFVGVQRAAHLHQADTELFLRSKFASLIALYMYMPPFTSSTWPVM